jgi:hypothetical protein
MQEVPVDWEALEDAFENNAPEVHSYLHLNSGEVLRVVDGIADPEMHSRISGESTYLRIESVSSREQYRWMERFIQMVETPPLRAALNQAIDGKGAFRRFKDVLMSQSVERERWFVFRSERLRVFMEAWLTAHSIAPIARPTPTTPPPAEGDPPPPVLETSQERRAPSAEGLRRQVEEICEALGTRDLDRILAFAQFIHARRIERNISLRSERGSSSEHSRPEGSAGEHSILENPEVSDPIGSADGMDDESPTNEPRKMTLVR